MGGGGPTPLSFISVQHTPKFVYHVIDNMCVGASVSHEMYEDCPLDKFWLAVQQMKTIVRDITLEKLTKEKFIDLLLPLDQETTEKVYEAINARRGEISDCLFREAVENTYHLKDFDWNVRLAVASDKVLDLSESLLTLHLHTSSPKNEKDASDLCVEMTAAQVDTLLEELKGAQDILSQLPLD
ncbi:COMM domain-containing protein 8-like [Homarus americanus]|uniref:COMM domain-containing protein 8-like n=1 Tax=Homarus americanus TaxID=6706 RepID=A0A8J5JX84_HOMAM|nr:COMM domain-containing protein 8-like [Homarus americanus]KAG7163991.1 COMM domain-containing protein 8-like [Homarus americanus]